MNPWDIPPHPKIGDPTPDITWPAVGRALSEWEQLELYLSRLYARFLGIRPIQAIAKQEYRDAGLFKKRADIITMAADRYFFRSPDQEGEAIVYRTMNAIRHFSKRRNDIAHGVVKIDWDVKKSFIQAIDANEYALVQPSYRDKNFDGARIPIYIPH